jgi:cyclic pyranopterin phosphate synthase
MKDRFGRTVNYLRISVVDRCNLRCQFCMPVHGLRFHSAEELLSFEEIVRIVQVANRLGIDRARLTGGEPLVRPKLSQLIRMLRQETELRELSMTTNGMLLERYADELAAAGLDWINVSFHSLKPERFRQVTRFGQLQTVLRGIERAAQAGIHPIKLNTLILKRFNDDEIDEMVQLTIEHDLIVRFLELMPIGEAVRLNGLGSYINLTQVKQDLIKRYSLVPAETSRGNGPAKYWQLPGAKGKIGFITPISDKYCDTCNRMRLTANGEIRPCLAYDTHVKLGTAIKAGDLQAIETGLEKAAWIKPAGHHWEEGQITQTIMSTLGG